MAALALLLLGAPAGASASSPDRAATDTYLQADYALAVAFAHNRSAANAAEQRAGAAIAAECPKVLAGAPGNPQASSPAPPPRNFGARAQGEADRHQHQFSLLTGEFETTLRVDAFKPDAAAFAKFVETVSPLRWGDPAVARSVQAEISILKIVLEPGPAMAVCADMRAWVASGYRTLSPATIAFEAAQEGKLGAISTAGPINPERALRRYEGPSERGLAKRIEALHAGDILETGGETVAKSRQRLGLEEPPHAPSRPRPKIIGRGRAHSGAKFEVEIGRGLGPGCRYMVTVSFTVRSAEATSNNGGTSSLRCLSGGVPKAHPELSCNNGLIEVISTTLAATREVRMTLSNGRTITSGVIPVARRHGGPAGAYVQAVAGPSPFPLSLSELDSTGAVLRTVAVRAVRGCRRAKRSAGESRVVELVHRETPTGRAFTILASSSVHQGHRTIFFLANGLGGSLLETRQPAGQGQGQGAAAARYFPWTLSVGCGRATVSAIYGQLKPPATTVLVATATTPLTPLTQVPLPPALKVPGTLAYALLTGLPTELVVRDAGGRTLVREDLTARAKRETEYCEGYAEPAA